MEQTTLGLQTQTKNGELAVSASAALAKATIEAKFSIALHRPRSVETARVRLMQNCQRKGFAETAKYGIPRWNSQLQKKVLTEGFSIRFAEAAIQSWGNVDVSANIAFEDDEKRMVRVTVTDLETNISFTDEVVLNKLVERTQPKEGDQVVSERLNSAGKKVYTIKATEDELLMKVNAAKSKSIRTSGLRLLPQDILDEAWDACTEAIRSGGKDPALEKKKVCDSFAKIGVLPKDLEEYLGHSLDSVSPQELNELRGAYSAIKEGETSWADFLKASKPIDVTPVKSNPAPPQTQAATSKASDDVPMGGATPLAAKDAKPVKAAQDELAAMITSEGISFDTFKAWMLQTNTIDEAVICDDFTMIPTQVAESLLAKPKMLTPAIKMMKAGGAK